MADSTELVIDPTSEKSCQETMKLDPSCHIGGFQLGSEFMPAKRIIRPLCSTISPANPSETEDTV